MQCSAVQCAIRRRQQWADTREDGMEADAEAGVTEGGVELSSCREVKPDSSSFVNPMRLGAPGMFSTKVGLGVEPSIRTVDSQHVARQHYLLAYVESTARRLKAAFVAASLMMLCFLR